MMPMGTPQQVFALRQQLWDAGFRPVPIYSPDASHDAAGKAPRGADWGDKARQDPPVAAVAPPTPDALNTGILCDGLRAIDIDVDNPTIAHSIRAKCLAMFGETAMRYRSNSPRVLLVYRAAEGAPPKRVITGNFGKVEVLGRGQQFVGFGVHPSGADLQWLPEAPGEIDVSSLRALTEDEISAFLEACAPSIGADASQAKTKDRTAPRSDRRLGADALQVVAALSGIPNSGPADWEAWNRIGMATWAATGGGEAGRAAFHAWSEQHASYDAAETNARWDHYAASPPTQIGAGTLFYMARQSRQETDDAGVGEPEGLWEGFEPAADDGEPDVAPPNAETEARPKVLRTIYLPALHMRPVPERRWIVPDWLPVRQVTLNYADGGVGKTLLAMQLMAATALAKSWCGLAVQPCPSVGLFSEDDETELHIRLDAIRRHYGAEFTDMGDVHPIDATGADNILAHFDGNHMTPTPRFQQLRECALDTGARLVVIDTAATTFGGNENDRSQVTQYVGTLLTSLAHDIDGAVLLNAHPSRSGMATGSLDSGSTGWSNSARSRWAMTRPEGEDGKPQMDSSERILTRRKSNAAAAGETLALAWQQGVFAPKTAPDGMGHASRKDAAEAAFLAALKVSPRPVFTDPRTSNYAPRVFQMTPIAADYRVPELAEAMRNLMARGRVIVVAYKRDYKTAYLLREAE
tara:strand:+ start:1210 stop:3288 length:2079 start_codon:yes stop_codon:yes gene_type:complete